MWDKTYLIYSRRHPLESRTKQFEGQPTWPNSKMNHEAEPPSGSSDEATVPFDSDVIRAAGFLDKHHHVGYYGLLPSASTEINDFLALELTKLLGLT